MIRYFAWLFLTISFLVPGEERLLTEGPQSKSKTVKEFPRLKVLDSDEFNSNIENFINFFHI